MRWALRNAALLGLAALALLWIPLRHASARLPSHTAQTQQPATGKVKAAVWCRVVNEDVGGNLEESVKVSGAIAAAKAILAERGDFVYLTLINAAFFKLTANWLCNVKAFPEVEKRTLILCTDKITCETLQQTPSNATFYALSDSKETSRALWWGEQGYVDFLAGRARLLSALLHADLPLLLFETDAVWLRDPHAYFRHQLSDSDLSVPLKGYPDKGLTLTFDPMLLRPTAAVKGFFHALSEALHANASLYDQDLLDAYCKQQKGGVHCNELPWDEIADGKWFKLLPAITDRVRPYIVNNNYYVGVENKIARQALNGLWFLDAKGACRLPTLHKRLQPFQ